MSSVLITGQLKDGLTQLLLENEHVPAAAYLFDFLNKFPGVVVVDTKSFNRMRDAEDKLLLLEGYGVDNWDGYGDAMEEFHAMKGAEDE